jgi:AraC family transcriptional regulator of arabinose operon
MNGMAKGMHNPAEARTHGQIPTYIWTGHEVHSREHHIRRPRGTPPNWHVIYTLDGRGYFGQRGVRFDVGSGDLVLLGPDCEHDYGCEKNDRWNNLYAHFTPRPQWLELMKWPAISPGLHHLRLRENETRAAIESAMRRCNAYRQAAFSNFAHELAMAALEEVLLLAAHENSYSHENQRISSAIRRVIAYVIKNLERQHSIAELARLAKLSPSRFSHRFKSETGEAVISYLIRLRLQKAAALLEFEGKTVKEAAAASGFTSQFYFSRQFKRWYMLSPSEYKRNVSALRLGRTENDE